MMAANGTPTNSSSSLHPPSAHPGRQDDRVESLTDGEGAGAGGSEPFVQLASWGHGSFTPLAQFTAGGLLLGGGGDGGAGLNLPAVGSAGAVRLYGRKEEKGDAGGGDRVHAIRTREGSLEIAPAGGEPRH